MAKDPAFLFYPSDWVTGTMLLTRAQKGAYMDLLMCQFNNGHMSLEDIRMILGEDFDTMWEAKLRRKFSVDPDGMFYNEKLEEEINKRKKFTESRRANRGGHTTNDMTDHKEGDMNSHMSEHMTPHMENENENRNEDRKEGGVGGSVVIYDAKTLYKEFSNSEQWKVSILTSIYANGVTEAELNQYMIQFIQELRDTDRLNKPLSEYRRHFINWLKIQVKNRRQTPQTPQINAKKSAAAILARGY